MIFYISTGKVFPYISLVWLSGVLGLVRNKWVILMIMDAEERHYYYHCYFFADNTHTTFPAVVQNSGSGTNMRYDSDCWTRCALYFFFGASVFYWRSHVPANFVLYKSSNSNFTLVTNSVVVEFITSASLHIPKCISLKSGSDYRFRCGLCW